MERLCQSKSQKLSFFSDLSESSYSKCKFKLEYPPFAYADENVLVQQISYQRNSRLNNLSYPQNLMSKRKLKFQCHYEERKKRAEYRRKKIIQRLKKIYQIDVEGLDEDIKKNIIMKTEIFEREKKEREKRKLERSVIMITRLLEEQKYKNRARKIYIPPWSKTPKRQDRVKPRGTDFGSKMCFSEIGEESIFSKKKVSRQTLTAETLKPETAETGLYHLPRDEGEMSSEEEKAGILPRCEEIKKIESLPKIFPREDKLKSKHKPPIEKCLESTPRQVIFKDYQKNVVYLQDAKITNVSCETIHCRYLGIVVHTKTEDRFPVGVAVRDSVKLRPGLSCSTKIRLCSQDDTKKLECSIVYETRRPRAFLQHSWFLLPVACIPVQAIVKVTPLKIIFPTLCWYEATGLEGAKLLCRNIKIENSGRKACSCRISNKKLEEETDRETIEGEGEGAYINYGLDPVNDFMNQDGVSSPAYTNEVYFGEYSPFYEDNQEIPRSILEELIEGIFGPFRFSEKFYIEIPPLSTVIIQVRFIPHYRGFHHETFSIQFEDCDNCKEVLIELVGDIKKTPLRVEPQVIDLKTCIANSGVYSGAFKVFNDSKGPHWVVLKVPSSVKNHAHVYPRTTIILPFSSSDFSVRVYPRVTLARDAPRYYSEDSQIFEFPIFIHPGNVGSCKRDYLKIYVLALVTDYHLQLSPSDITFGTVSTVETVRTELELTNHSLAAQEYGFLNLPKGVRVEPNMGFGTILPKESITLYLLYSPEEEFLECEEEQKSDEFQVIVTSIAKYGGFREKLESYEEPSKILEFIWEEDHDLSSIKTNPLSIYEDSEEFDECDENSSIEGEELCWKAYQQENKIREFLKKDRDELSDVFACTKLSSKEDTLPQKTSSVQFQGESFPGELNESFKEILTPKKDSHIVNCHAVVIRPRCRLSHPVIQLPATPYSSFTLYRFRLTCVGEDVGDCVCGFRKISKKYDSRSKSRISFEFQYVCPHFKLEPECGTIKSGESIPITIIYRPALQPKQELETEKEQSTMEMKDGKEMPTRSSSGVKTKGKPSSPKVKASTNTIENVMNAASQEMKSFDGIIQDQGSEKSNVPFIVESKVRCIVKITSCIDSSEKSEIHEMVLICPIINPKFVYLGKSQEIKFDKVFVGTTSKIVFEIQNVSLDRISPSATFLSPVGPFFCSAGIQDVEVDPEHIWRQPLIYAPLIKKGIEKQFFEIYCGSTNILLTVSGEGIYPDYKIIPNFACCLMESKPGSTEELKVEVENLSTVPLNISIQTKFLARIPDFGKTGDEVEDTKMKKEKPTQKEEVKKEKPTQKEEVKKEKPTQKEEVKKEKTAQKEEVKDKKKPKKSENQNIKFWEEIPEEISSSVQNLEDVKEDEDLKIFTMADENKAFVVPPLGKHQIKIQFTPPPDEFDGAYAVRYGLMLEKVSQLKEVLVVGKIVRGK